MATAPKALVAGNWKMNGLTDALGEIEALNTRVAAAAPDCEILICPAFTLIAAAKAAAGQGPIAIGAQDCHANASGAHTGDISAEMLADLGAGHVIVGHSERRADHGETSSEVVEKAKAAWRAGLVAIICVGETEAERDAGKTLAIIDAQLSLSIPDGAKPENTVVAYEPVWAIGTGRTPSVEDVAEVHSNMRERLAHRFGHHVAAGIRLLYGGSVKPGNAAELMAAADVNGALVGGASLKATDFDGILNAYR